MRRPRFIGIAFAVLLLAGKTAAIRAQQPGRATKEQIHPELVDTTWGPRTAAAWDLAHAGHWDEARQQFEALHAAHPAGVEALVGLAFLARAAGNRKEALHWYQLALDAEPSADIRKQIEAVDWDRQGSVDISGESAHVGTETVADWSLAFVVPVVPQFSLSGRAGVLGAGDPLRGVFLDSTGDGGVQARVLSIGGVLRPTDQLAFTTRVEYWTATVGEAQTFLWFDGTERFGQRFALRIGARPLGGTVGAPQLSGAADIVVAPNNTVTLEVVQGTHAAEFEPRTQIRVFYYAQPAMREIIRAGLVRDTGPTNQATTAFLSGTYFLRPTVGVRVEVSSRRGAFARSTIGGGLVLRW